MLSTKNSLIGRFADSLRINKRFHKHKRIRVDEDSLIVSPVEAKVAHIGEINEQGELLSKRDKKVLLKNFIGDYAGEFVGERYFNFYLNPFNTHFWITPCEGRFVYTQKNEGKSVLPVFIGLENILGVEMFSKAVKRNASIGSVFETREFPLAMIAVGSLNVNRIHVNYEEGEVYEKGHPCGYFSIGSSMLLCFPRYLKVLVEKGHTLRIGQRILI